MTYFIAGVIALIVFSGALNAFLGTNPKWLSTQMRRIGGVAVIAFGLFLLSRGQFELAVPAVIAGAMLLGFNLGQGIPGFKGLGGGGAPAKGQVSTVSTAFLTMTLDLDSGRMEGRFIAGTLAGQTLDALAVARLIQAFSEIDAESGSLLEAYLDRRDPRWRQATNGDARPGSGEAVAGAMTQKEAYEILGLQPGAGEEAIRAAHRALMKKLHPDQGGSTWLATRVNQAKDVLLNSHRRNS